MSINVEKQKKCADGRALSIPTARLVPTMAIGTTLPMRTTIMCRWRFCLHASSSCYADDPNKLPSAQLLAVGPFFLSRNGGESSDGWLVRKYVVLHGLSF
jgi:hypothetical protein